MLYTADRCRNKQLVKAHVSLVRALLMYRTVNRSPIAEGVSEESRQDKGERERLRSQKFATLSALR